MITEILFDFWPTKVDLGRLFEAFVVAFQHFKMYRKTKALSLSLSNIECGELRLNAHLAPNVAEIVPPGKMGRKIRKRMRRQPHQVTYDV